jgi:hypothetical protein
MQLFPVISQAGPLPIKSASFKAPVDGPVVFVVTGSAYSNTANVTISFSVLLDNNVIGTAQVFSNAAQTHRVLPPLFIPVDLTYGNHTCVIMASPTATDYNDHFRFCIRELCG